MNNERVAPATSAPETQTGQVSFWSALDQQFEDDAENNAPSIDSEMLRWKGLSAPSRNSNPILVMESLKKDYPCMYITLRQCRWQYSILIAHPLIFFVFKK